ncbi:MAG TPA: hypothetical protein VMC81_00675 [Rhodocyclaceae bacterium]|nr:hypothetical protein [Rhodocyclaceae bacterium]
MHRIDNQGRLSAGEERLRGLIVLGLAGNANAYQSFLKELSVHLRVPEKTAQRAAG